MKINKKLLSTILAGIVSFSIVGCVSDSNNSKQNSNSKTVETKKDKNETKKTDSTLIKDLNLEQTQGPIKVKITEVEKAKLHLSEKDFNDLSINYSDLTNKGKDLNIVAIYLEIENTSDKSVDIYPTQGTLALNTKEQIEDRMIFPGSEDLSGEYLGNTLKKGVVAFVVDSNLKDINSIQYKFEASEEQGDSDEDINFYEFLFNINLNK